VVLDVDVVERVRVANGKLQSASARKQGLKRGLSAHAIAIEKRWMRCLGSDEIIAAIMRRSYNHVVPSEHVERACKNRNRQMRAVAIEGDNAPAAWRREVCEHRGQACRKALAFLGHDTCHTSRQPD